MSDLLKLVEWAEDNYDIIELAYDKGCHCYNFSLQMEWCDYILTICGIAFLDGDVGNRVTISNDFNDNEVEINNFSVEKLDTIKQDFVEMIESDDFE